MTTHQQTLAIPPVGDVGDGARALVAISTLVAGAWALWLRLRTWRRRRQERQTANDRAIREYADTLHHLLRWINGGELPPDELRRHEVLVRRLRRDLARVDGHLELLTEADAEEERDRKLWATRTQRLNDRKAEIRARAIAPEDHER